MALFDEDLVPFAVGIRSLPGRPHISTGYRFITKGSRGILLETILVGGRRYTSRQALRRFVTAVTNAANRAPSCAESRQHADPDPASIEADLDDAGL
jgi:hypothetical protein